MLSLLSGRANAGGTTTRRRPTSWARLGIRNVFLLTTITTLDLILWCYILWNLTLARLMMIPLLKIMWIMMNLVTRFSEKENQQCCPTVPDQDNDCSAAAFSSWECRWVCLILSDSNENCWWLVIILIKSNTSEHLDQAAKPQTWGVPGRRWTRRQKGRKGWCLVFLVGWQLRRRNGCRMK